VWQPILSCASAGSAAGLVLDREGNLQPSSRLSHLAISYRDPAKSPICCQAANVNSIVERQEKLGGLDDLLGSHRFWEFRIRYSISASHSTVSPTVDVVSICDFTLFFN
jgi:hypothetical protein